MNAPQTIHDRALVSFVVRLNRCWLRMEARHWKLMGELEELELEADRTGRANIEKVADVVERVVNLQKRGEHVLKIQERRVF